MCLVFPIVVKVLKDTFFFPPGQGAGRDQTRKLGGFLFLLFLLCPFSLCKEVAMFRKVSNFGIFYTASFRWAMTSAKITALRVWPEVKFLRHLSLL